jgi:hypothetical protein
MAFRQIGFENWEVGETGSGIFPAAGYDIGDGF